jgi:hypothetical protein
MITDYPQLTWSDMAKEDAEKLLSTLEGDKLESFKKQLSILNGMKAKVWCDIPRDGCNFAWEGVGHIGGLIDFGDDYSIHS